MMKNEQNYLSILRARLTGSIGHEDLEDILADYAEHFSIGRSLGRSDEEIYSALGSPEEAAREIRAACLVRRAEHTRSAKNIWKAMVATSGISFFNLAVAIVPFVLITVLLVILVIAGLAMIIGGPVLLLAAVLQMAGIAITVPWWTTPLSGALLAIGLSVAGVVLIVVVSGLAWVLYGLAVRFLMWNIRLKKGEPFTMASPPSPESLAIEREGATALDFRLRSSAGELMLSPGAEDPHIIRLAIENGSSKPVYDCTTGLSNEIKTVRIRDRSFFPGHAAWHSGTGASRWDIRLNPAVRAALDIRNGAGVIRLALGDLDISGLKIKNGAGETHVDLAGYHGGDFSAEIHNGMGNLIIRVPQKSNTRIVVRRGMGDIKVSGMIAEGDTFIVPEPVPNAPRITCQVKQGIGSLSLETV
jgi:uncharacterized membrane protein